MCLYDEPVVDHDQNESDAVDPARVPEMAGSACSYNDGGLTCGCPGYVNDGAGYCRTCSHSGSFHW
jgi:hypothetical protein